MEDLSEDEIERRIDERYRQVREEYEKRNAAAALKKMHEDIDSLAEKIHEEEEQPYPEVQPKFDVPDEQKHHEEEHHEEEHHEQERHETESGNLKEHYQRLYAERKRINEQI
jgi:hypothetical protein